MSLTPEYPATKPDPTICCKHCNDDAPGGYCTHCPTVGRGEVLHHTVSVFYACDFCSDPVPNDPVSQSRLCVRCAARLADTIPDGPVEE